MLKEDKPTVHIKTENTHLKIQPEGKTDEAFDAVKAFVMGKPFSNENLDYLGDYIQETLKSVEGFGKERQIAEDAQRIVDDTTRWMREKNYDEILQDALVELKNAGDKGATPLSELAESVSSSLTRSIPKITRLARGIIYDKEFRGYLADLFEIFSSKLKEKKKYRGHEERRETYGVESTKQDILEGGTVKTSLTMEREEIGTNYEDKPLGITEDDEVTERIVNLIMHLREKHDYVILVNLVFDLLDDLNSYYRAREYDQRIEKANIESTKALNNIKVLIERLSNCSLDPFLFHLKNLYQSRHDKFFWEIRRDLRDLLIDPNKKYQDKESSKQMLDEIYAKLGLNDEYEEEFKKVLEEGRMIFDGIVNDPIMQQFTSDWERLVSDLIFDSNGNVSYSTALDSLQLINKAILPLIRRRLQNVQLPNIEVDSSKYNYSVSNVMLSLNDLLPENLHVDIDSSIDIEPGHDIRGFSQVKLRFHPVEFDIENMDFYYKSKNGLKYKDVGKLRISTRDGWAEMIFNFIVKENMFLLEYVKSDAVMGEFSIDFIESKHDILNKIFYSVIKMVIKGRLEHSLTETYTIVGSKICKKINKMVASTLDKKRKLARRMNESGLARRDAPSKVVVGVGDERIPFIQREITE
jgi:t-SNARE complex subunit (syntaxin)